MFSFLPSQCAVCRSWPCPPVCTACVSRFTFEAVRCSLCALELPSEHMSQCGACLRKPPPLDACLSALDYAYPWSNLISRYKFNQHPSWSKFFSNLLQAAPGVQQALDASDWVIPLPLSNQRLQTRGFNQAWELACQLRSASARFDAHLLLRIKDTPAQSALKRGDRLKNVQGAFAVDPLRAAQLRGARVVLVDDVMTSGASVFSAAGALREAGAARVTALVLARTALP